MLPEFDGSRTPGNSTKTEANLLDVSAPNCRKVGWLAAEQSSMENIFENQVRYTDEHFTNIVNKITSLLDRRLVVGISGMIVKPDGCTIEECNTLFYTRAQFDSYYNNLQDTSDIEERKFTGTVKIIETNIRFNRQRS